MKSKYSWGIRNWIQLVIFVLTIGIGIKFYLFVMQASGGGAITIKRPAGVEGFLPIGALMAWKRFFLTGDWDLIHPAAMVILGFAAAISFLFKKSFCSWFCPVGTLSEWLWKVGERVLGKNYKLYAWIDYPLRSIKYFLLGFFVFIIARMSTAEIHEFMQSPYYKIADVKMLFFFTRMSLATALFLLFFAVASLVIRNFWCRYFCPYGALMGTVALFSPSRIYRNSDTCIHCERCVQACPASLPVSQKNRIDSPECTGCMDCTAVCPVEKALSFQTIGIKNGWKVATLGTTIIIVFLGIVYLAKITGHWKTGIPDHELTVRLRAIDSPETIHPGFSKTKNP